MKKILILLFCITIPMLVFSQTMNPLTHKFEFVIWNYQTLTSSSPLKLPSSYYSGKKSVKIAGEQGKETEKKLNAALTVKKDTTELRPLIIIFAPQFFLSGPLVNTEEKQLSSVFSNKKPLGTPTVEINYKRMRTTGWIMVGSGVGCQAVGAMILGNYYNSEKIYNRIKVTKTNIHIDNEITHYMKKSTAVTISATLGVIGAGLEIWGGIKIGKAKIGLNGITIPIN